jgi:CRP-like cAMP-binding protein
MKNSQILLPMAHKLGSRSSLGTAEYEALLALPHRVADLDRTRFIAREGEPVSHCSLLLSGFAYCHKVTGDGARQVLSIHFPGDLLDLQKGVAGMATCNVQPLSAAKVAFIDRPALFALAAEYPRIAAALWADAGANASILAEWLVNVGRRNARSRIAHLVCEMAVRQDASGTNHGPNYAWALTQEQLGDATGLTSVHVNRTMQGLRQEGLLGTAHRQLSVLNWQGLCEAGDFTLGYLQLGDTGTQAAGRMARN